MSPLKRGAGIQVGGDDGFRIECGMTNRESRGVCNLSLRGYFNIRYSMLVPSTMFRAGSERSRRIGYLIFKFPVFCLLYSVFCILNLKILFATDSEIGENTVRFPCILNEMESVAKTP